MRRCAGLDGGTGDAGGIGVGSGGIGGTGDVCGGELGELVREIVVIGGVRCFWRSVLFLCW